MRLLRSVDLMIKLKFYCHCLKFQKLPLLSIDEHTNLKVCKYGMIITTCCQQRHSTSDLKKQKPLTSSLLPVFMPCNTYMGVLRFDDKLMSAHDLYKVQCWHLKVNWLWLTGKACSASADNSCWFSLVILWIIFVGSCLCESDWELLNYSSSCRDCKALAAKELH